MLSGGRRASITAIPECQLACLSKEHLTQILREFPDVAKELAVVAMQRLKRLRQESGVNPHASRAESRKLSAAMRSGENNLSQYVLKSAGKHNAPDLPEAPEDLLGQIHMLQQYVQVGNENTKRLQAEDRVMAEALAKMSAEQAEVRQQISDLGKSMGSLVAALKPKE